MHAPAHIDGESLGESDTRVMKAGHAHTLTARGMNHIYDEWKEADDTKINCSTCGWAWCVRRTRRGPLPSGVLLAILIAMAASMFGAFQFALPDVASTRLNAW